MYLYSKLAARAAVAAWLSMLIVICFFTCFFLRQSVTLSSTLATFAWKAAPPSEISTGASDVGCLSMGQEFQHQEPRASHTRQLQAGPMEWSAFSVCRGVEIYLGLFFVDILNPPVTISLWDRPGHLFSIRFWIRSISDHTTVSQTGFFQFF